VGVEKGWAGQSAVGGGEVRTAINPNHGEKVQAWMESLRKKKKQKRGQLAPKKALRLGDIGLPSQSLAKRSALGGERKLRIPRAKWIVISR